MAVTKPTITSCCGTEVWSTTSPPVLPPVLLPVTSRAPCATKLNACSLARKRGASNSASMSKNTTTSARSMRCNTASVPTNTDVWGSMALVVGLISCTGRPAAASSSSRKREIPIRIERIFCDPQAKHTTGRVAAHRGHDNPCSSGCCTAAPHASQRATVRHASQATARARPFTFSTHTTRLV